MAGWDVHTHLIPPTVLGAAQQKRFGLSIDGNSLVVDGRTRLPLRRMASPQALLEWVDAQGLDGALVSVPPPLFRYELGAEWADLVNEGLRQLAEPRLRVLGHLVLAEPAMAVSLAAEGVFSGFALGTAGFRERDELWQVLHELEAFTLIHPGHCDDARLAPYYLSNLLGNPYETALAAAELVFGEVPGRFPGIRFCLCHGGGVAAALAGRWQRGVATDRPGVPEVGVADALRRFYVDDLVHDPAVLGLVTEVFGPDRVLVGSDWPFPMGADQLDRDRAAKRAAETERLTRPLSN
ncbi:amidohydrolase family protein [Kribbella deserti]|uniref:Amidohydrolase family protein n=1 Tax=Kribbella deserti TaxID=1926257 RepID=A0ABV6QKV5_9ACTN